MDEIARTVIFAGVVALIFRVLLFAPFNIPSSSMFPGLLVGDFLFVSKYSYGYSSLSVSMGMLPFNGRIFGGEPERGDVIVFKLPRDDSTDYIKRLVGLPGDRIQVRHGLLHINGVAVARTKLDSLAQESETNPPEGAVDYIETFPDGHSHVIREDGDDYKLDNTPEFEVPEGHYFMMGDNRDNSSDSRTPVVGFVPRENLVGRAEILFFSIGDGASFLQFWKWPKSVRWSRMFGKIK